MIKRSNLPFADLKIENLEIAPATKEGANFSSELMRAKINFFGGQSESFIVKTIVTQEVANDVLVNQFNVHEKEMFVYGVLMPEYSKILDGLETGIAPLQYDVDRVNSAIILEDLSPKGFVIADRTQGLDENHCELTLQKLAKLHAASMVLNHKNPKVLKPFGVGRYRCENSRNDCETLFF